MRDRLERVMSFLDKYEYVLLVLALCITLLGYPFVIHTGQPSLRLHICITIVLLTGLYSASTHKKFLISSMVLGFLTICLRWIEFVIHDDYLLSGGYLLTGLLFFSFIAYNLILVLHRERKITHHLIFGAIAGYLIIGLLGTFVYTLIELLLPGSFSLGVNATGSLPDFIYYSYVTMTTLGYGDMLPISYAAQSWSVIFTIAGQMYLTVLIGVIVGKYIHSSKNSESE